MRLSKLCIVILVCSTVALLSCDSNTNKPNVAQAFTGVWRNVHDGYMNWWVVAPQSVINYGMDDARQTCVRHNVTILDGQRLLITFGITAAAKIRLDGEYLILEDFDKKARAVHRRVALSDICRGPDGYLPGAPYSAKL